MKFLLFFLGISFFFLFFLLSLSLDNQDSLIGNIFIEANIYIVLSIFMIFKVLKNDFKKKKITNQESFFGIGKYFSFSFLFPLIKVFFSKYIYYIACIFFYISIFLLLKVFLQEIHIPKMFFICNIVILSLYFIEHKFKVFQDFLRINTIIISLYYIVFQLGYLLGIWNDFLKEDIYNIIIIFILLSLFIYSSRKKKFIPVLSSYMVLYLFLEYLVLLKYFSGNISLGASIICFIVSIILLGKTSFISDMLKISKKLVRIWGLIYSYMFLFFSGVLIFSSSPYFLMTLPAVVIVSMLLYDFHSIFQNYISLFIGSFGFLIFGYGVYSFFIPETIFFPYIFVLLFFISGVFLFIKNVFSLNYLYDIYFFQIFSLLVNISGVVCFFFFQEISILSTALLFLWESIYLFFLYYNFRNKLSLG